MHRRHHSDTITASAAREASSLSTRRGDHRHATKGSDASGSSGHSDESKRQKMLRWFKNTFSGGSARSSRRREAKPSPPRTTAAAAAPTRSQSAPKTPRQTSERSRKQWQASTYTYGDAPSFYRPHTADTRSEPRSKLFHDSGKSTSSLYDLGHRKHSYAFMSDVPRSRYSYAPQVLIIGAGIGGLCLAQALKQYDIPFTVFERDPTPNFRNQGYRQRINSIGYEALKDSLARKQFEIFLRSTGHFFPGTEYMDALSGRVVAGSAAVFTHDIEAYQQVFSVNRAMLRSLLLTDLDVGTDIQYDMAFKRFCMLPNGHVEVQFENGTVVEGTVLIGADGTTSRVRRQYIPRHISLLDTDSGAIYGKTLITPEIEAHFSSNCTKIVMNELAAVTLVIEPRCRAPIKMHEFPAEVASAGPSSHLPSLHKYICWVLIARASHFHTHDGMTVDDMYALAPEQIAALSTRMTASWCPSVRNLVRHQAPEWGSFMRISTMAPEIRAWQPTPVTLLGDAIHTMAPAGIASNAALQDACVLAKLFRDVGVNVEAIAQYERDMRARAREGIELCIDAGKRVYSLPDLKDMLPIVY